VAGPQSGLLRQVRVDRQVVRDRDHRTNEVKRAAVVAGELDRGGDRVREYSVSPLEPNSIE